MQPPHQHQRINLAELKAEIVKRLGLEGSEQYFYYLNRFLSLKLSKVEFNKLCLQIVGRDNIPLHNQFIHSILKNACGAKAPPPTHDKEVLKPVRAVGNNEPPGVGHKQNVSILSVLSNGDILPLSPQKIGAGTCHRKALDLSKAFGSNGRTNFVFHQSPTEHDSNSDFVLENGDLSPHDFQMLAQHHQGLAKQAQNEGEVSHHQCANLSLMKRLPDGLVSVHRKEADETILFEDMKEAHARSLLHAPIGFPSCPVRVGGAHRMMPLEIRNACVSSFNSGGLFDTAGLRERMEHIASTLGLKGVTMDCANLLNNGLDAYLEGLISSCIQLVGARTGHEPTKSGTNMHQTHLKLVNGVRLGHHHHMQSNGRPMEQIQEIKPHFPLSLLDFKVAMEVNPQQLGEDWPLLLEKIRMHAFEE